MKKKLRLVFMGTPEFAVPSLKALIDSRHNVVAVVTQPDRPKGRGRALTQSPVKELAEKHKIEVIQPPGAKEKGFIQRLKELNPDLIVVIAYGHILPKPILDIPSLGCINVHASLLPKYRGASPINWAIIEGEVETGVTTILMDEGMDTGDILLTGKTTIEKDDNYENLQKRLSLLGADVLLKTIESMKEGTLKLVTQRDSDATYASLLKKEDGLINWNLEAKRINNIIRGLNPWPGTFTNWKGKRLKILSGSTLPASINDVPGTVIRKDSDGIQIATKKGVFLITKLQPENKRAMEAKDFLKGYDIKEGEVLTN
jgi:methionyl-tRNA formyltransferase